MSFGMIFSIIIIVIALAVAGYVIWNFIKFRDCSQIGQFYDNLKTEVDKAYGSQGTQKSYNGYVPTIVDDVCIGKLTDNAIGDDKIKQTNFKKASSGDSNVFLSPYPAKCGRKYAEYKLDHVATSEFFCVSSVSGKITLKVTKDTFEPTVRLGK